MTIHHRQREHTITAMGGANMKHTNIDEEVNPSRRWVIATTRIGVEGNLVVHMTRVIHPQHYQRLGAAAPTSSYFFALSEPPTPLSGFTTVCTQATMSHNSATHNPHSKKIPRIFYIIVVITFFTFSLLSISSEQYPKPYLKDFQETI
jgi:hypothetical protein